MTPFGPVATRMLLRALQDPIKQLHYSRRECQQLVDHINTFIASLEEKGHLQDLSLVDLQKKLYE